MRSNYHDQPLNTDEKLIRKKPIPQYMIEMATHIPSAGSSPKNLLQNRPAQLVPIGNSSGNAICRDLVPVSEKFVGTTVICT